VKSDVIKSLNLVGSNGSFATHRQALLWLGKKVDVHLLLGGVMEIETKLYNPGQAQQVTAAYSQAIGRHLARYGRQIIINKQRIVSRRFQDAGGRVAKAQADLAEFRRLNNLAEPEQQLSNALAQRAAAEARLQAKQIEYQTLSQLRGPESAELAAVQSDIVGLRAQIAKSAAPSAGIAEPNVAGLSEISLRYFNLYREVRFQQAMYDVYQRSAEQVAVEELASQSASYIQTIDPAHVDADRKFNVWAIALLAGVILLALFTEWYAPATGLFRRRIANRRPLVAEKS
jgi:capsule polysaccharide export protein KpsE/RkpR